jgi:capsular exopolysaccharide synthesis family protein
MAVNRSIQQRSDTGLFQIIGYKYLPFWPLFLALAAILLFLAFFYTRYITPEYKVSATLVIHDEQRGVQESETMRSLNAYAVNTTVENEIQVLTSRTLMNDVVRNLHLYAPLFEEGRVKPASAYLSSPVRVVARDPERLKAQEKVAFTFDRRTERVIIDSRHYALQQWVTTPYGVLRFERNPNQNQTTVRNLYFSLADLRTVAAAMGARLSVGATSKLSSVITIEYTDEVPQRGEDVVNHLLEAYNRASIENNNRLATGTLAFVNERIQDVERELDSIERTIQQFRTSRGIVDLSQQGKLYLESVAENDRRAAEISTQLAVLNQVEQFVRASGNRTGIVPTTLGIDDPVLANLLQKLNDLELQYANLRTRVGEENPMARSVENEIQKIRPNILNIVRNQRSQLQARLGNYNRSSSQMNATLRDIPAQERELLDISRQLAAKNETYTFLLQRREEAEISTASSTADSRVVDRAQASPDPVSSKRMLILAAALIAAFVLGIGYIFIKEGLTGKVLFRSTLAKATSIPVIGEIAFRKPSRRADRDINADPVLNTQFEQLLVALNLYREVPLKKKILVTSGLANEGKTFVSNHLAATLARSEHKVLLMDLNLHQPETSALHQYRDEKGFSDFIQGHAVLSALIRKTELPYLDLLPAGAQSRSITALLSNKKLPELLAQLEEAYDCIIIDAPATEIAADAFLLSPYCDTTLYLVRHGYTPGTLVQKLDENPRIRSINGLGIVFNGVKARGFLRKYYGYGYGYGHEHLFHKTAYSRAE